MRKGGKREVSIREDGEEVNERHVTREWEQKKQKKKEVKDVGGRKNESTRESERERKPVGYQSNVQERVRESEGWY